MPASKQADALPLRIPLLVAATGPKGAGVAKRIGADGLISMFNVVPGQRDFARAVVATMGYRPSLHGRRETKWVLVPKWSPALSQKYLPTWLLPRRFQLLDPPRPLRGGLILNW
jgi:hypothetical protein